MIEDATPFLLFGGFFAAIGVALALMGVFADLSPEGRKHRRKDGMNNG